MNYELPKISQPALRALTAEGITDLQKLAEYPRTKLAELHGIGPNALKSLEEAMKNAGIDLKNTEE